MMKKYRVYIWITIVLAALAIVLYNNDKKGTLKIESHAFAVADTSSVTKIKISDSKSALVFERQGNGWTVNEGFNARPKAVKAILGIISGLEVSSPVSKSMMDEVLNGFTSQALSVSIESSGSITKEYRISENDSLRIGSFAMLSGDNMPYVVRLMGYDGRITKLFPLDTQFWRDKTLFSYRLADILSVEIDYPMQPENSFGYYFFGSGDLEIKSLNTKKTIKIDKNKARNFLLNFSSVPFQLIGSERSEILNDSLNSLKPFCEIKVKDTGNHIKVVKTYRIPDPKNSGKFNINLMYALIQDDKMPVMIKYIDLDPIMRKFEDFDSK